MSVLQDSNPPLQRAAGRTDRSGDYDFAAAVWRRRKWLALAVACAGVAAAASGAMALPDIYRSTATVLVEGQQISEAFVRPSVTTELETRIQTIHQQMMSRARLSDLIARLNLYPDVRGGVSMDGLVERMRRDVKLSLSGVEQMTGRTATIAFNVSYTGREPRKVAEVVNTLVAAYVEENSRSRERQAARTAAFLKSQLDAVKQEVDAQELRADQFKEHHTAELPQQLEANLSALDRFSTRLRLNGEYQLRALERRDRLDRELRTMSSSRGSRVQVDGADGQEPSGPGRLEKLKASLVELRRKYSDRYPDVIRLKAEIAAAEASSGTGEATGIEPEEDGERQHTVQALTGIENDLEALRQEEQLLRRVIQTYEARVENAPKRRDELDQISREYSTSKDRYDTLLKRYEEAQLAESLEHGKNAEQFRVLDPAIPAAHPSAPNRLWLLTLGLFGSLALAFAAIVVAERLDTTFHSLDDLRSFVSVPTVAAIRRIPTHGQARAKRLRGALLAAAAVAAIALIATGSHYFASNNESLVRMTARGAQ
ncbi:MAG TPA: XrtA system polysaccharide chain length determinant [Vicinamibacterales bacterium]|nr:XrtA system polysaccharide chain length determinant [Vicinamibacterales bacterium]